jgi:hypothetical protein
MSSTLAHNRGYSIDVSKIYIQKMSSGEKYHIVDGGEETGNMGSLLLTLRIDESILNSVITGNVIIKNPGKALEKFKVSGQDEIIHIEMKTPHLEGSEQVLEFCIVSVNEFGQGADTTGKLGGGIKDNKMQLHFMSCEPMYLDISDWKGGEGELFNQDMFMKIASKGVDLGAFGDWLGLNVEGGLVNAIAPKYFEGKNGWVCGKQKEGMDIENTHNGIWLKTNSQLYPWGKETNSMTLMQLMKNMAENAIDENETWCNYVFYHDFDKWHFKSIKKMVEENKNAIPRGKDAGDIQTTSRAVYGIKDGGSSKEESDTGDPKIMSSKSVIASANHLKLWKDGAYASYYYHVEPDYSDPYNYYMDTAAVHKNKYVSYEYHRDWEEKSWNTFTVEKFKFLPEIIKTVIDTEKPNKNLKFRNIPEVYGYFENAYNSKNPHNKYDFLSSRQGNGSLGKRNDIMWQSMSDQTNLKLATIKTIQQDIIGPTRENYLEYIFKKNLKEKWNVYRHTICCDKIDEKRQFLAVIDDAKLIQENGKGGIYEYSWREVEMWPKQYINEGEEEGEVQAEIVSHPDAPITIAVVPESRGGLKGVMSDEENNITGKDGAYNINELLNHQVGDDVYTGPGINAAEIEESYPDGNDYPDGHQMMPVGGYWKIGDDPCLMREEGEMYGEFWKHIVEMNVIPADMLETISPIKPDPEEDMVDIETPDRIYFFDVQNAHDGLCSCPN